MSEGCGGFVVGTLRSKLLFITPSYTITHLTLTHTGKLHSSIHTLPDLLILHLQRLVINSNGGGKIRTLVKFPLSDQLNMRPYTTVELHFS